MSGLICRRRLGAAPAAAAAAAVLLLLLSAAQHAAAQGLGRDPRAFLGAADSYTSLTSRYRNAKGFKDSFKYNRNGACAAKAGSLCGGGAASDETATLTIAASPSKFDARNNWETGGVDIMSPVRDQGPCLACTSFALLGAVEAAVSMATRTSAYGRVWSAQDLHFCTGSDGEVKSCRSATMTAVEAIRQFINTVKSKGVVLEKCLPYDAPNRPPNEDLCGYKCKDKDWGANGQFKYVQITTPWEIQAHIRNYGGVMTRLDVYSDLRPFFQSNPGGTYTGPSRDASMQESHAVLLVGYDNDGERWLFRNSWGGGWGDRGYGWISYKATATGIGAPGDTFGVMFYPDNPPALPYSVAPGDNGCYWLTPPGNTWPSMLAATLNVQVQRLLLDNTERIMDLDRPLDQKPILVCGIPGYILSRLGRSSGPTPPPPQQPAPAPAPASAPVPAPAPAPVPQPAPAPAPAPRPAPQPAPSVSMQQPPSGGSGSGAWSGKANCDVAGSFLAQGTPLEGRIEFSSGFTKATGHEKEADFRCAFEWNADCSVADGGCGGGRGKQVTCQSFRFSKWADRCGEAPFPKVSRVIYCIEGAYMKITEYSPTCESVSGGYSPS